MTVHALILAGGRGSRLGEVRKAELRIGNRRLQDRVATPLRSLADQVLISTGPGAARVSEIGIGIADEGDSFGGPMAGIAAGAGYLQGRAAQDDILLTVSVDTPFLPDDFAERLVAALDGGAMAAYAAWGERLYPPNAAWRLSALWTLLAEERPASPKAALRRLGAACVDWSNDSTEDPFANLNTLADLIALGRRASLRGE